MVAANGVGHFRRTVGVLHRLVTAHPSVVVTVFCTRRHLEILGDWWRLEGLVASGARLVTEVECGVRWPLASPPEDLLGWRDALAGMPALGRADLVVSDNLAGVLRLRPDAVLQGSFLWSEVLAQDSSAEVRRFVANEVSCLRRHRPPMLCVGEIATPAVYRDTDAVPLAWMCERPAAAPRSLAGRLRIGVCGGTTDAAGHQASWIAGVLARGYDVVVDDATRGAHGGSATGVRVGFLHEVPMTGVDVVFCRPGAGTVMDCVATNTPFVTFHEPDSPEMAHIARRLAALGIADTLGESFSIDQVVAAVQRLSDPAEYLARSTHLAGLRKDGLDRAADWLAARLANTLARH